MYIRTCTCICMHSELAFFHMYMYMYAHLYYNAVSGLNKTPILSLKKAKPSHWAFLSQKVSLIAKHISARL